MTDELMYEIHDVEANHVYRIYFDGRFEGFPDGCVIVNRAIHHLRREAAMREASVTDAYHRQELVRITDTAPRTIK